MLVENSMPIASFEEENKLVQETGGASSQHFLGMSGWLVRKGLASNQTSADLTLLVIVGMMVTFSLYLIYHSSVSSRFVTTPSGVDPAVYENTGHAPTPPSHGL